MRLWTVSFFFGTFCLRYFSTLPHQHIIWGGCLIAFILVLSMRFIPALWLRILSGFCLGLAWACLYASWQLSWTLPSAMQAKDVMIEGEVISIPAKSAYLQQFIFKMDSFPGLKKPVKIRLSWYDRSPILHLGDRWRFLVRLKRPHGFKNLGGFDYEGQLFQQGIRATGYVRSSEENQRIKVAVTGYHLIDQFRQQLATQLNDTVHDRHTRAFMLAFTLGLRDQLNADDWQVLRATGTSHLVAISGLHISLVAGWIYLLVNFLWKQLPRLCLLVPAQQIASVAAILAATSYAMLSGFAIPAQRALMMIVVLMIARIRRTNLSITQGLMSALLFVLLIDPLSSFSPGFYLSFAAVAFIFYGLACRLKPSDMKWKFLRIQWLVTLGLLPLSLLLFQQISLIAWIANIIAIPVIGFVIVPISIWYSILLFFSTKLAAVLLQVISIVLNTMWMMLNGLSQITFAQWFKAIPSFSILITLLIAVLLALAPRRWPGRWLALIWALPLFFSQPSKPAYGDINFTLLDVGQGLAAVIQTATHVLVFDTGPKFSETFNAGEAVILPYLRYIGVKQINKLVISHGDNDHQGGLNGILNNMSVDEILTPKNNNISFAHSLSCQHGQKWQWDGVKFEFLFPSADKNDFKRNDSCVLKVSRGSHAILLTGDIEKAAEKWLFQTIPEQLQADILVAPHHGSQSSSTQAFIEAVLPKYVLFSTGYMNRYHHPRPEVLQRYQAVQASAFSTAVSGMLSFQITDENKLGDPQQYRLISRQIWTTVGNPKSGS